MKVSKKLVVCLPLIAALASCKTAPKHEGKDSARPETAAVFTPVQDYEFEQLDVVYLPRNLSASAFDKKEWAAYKAANAERKIAFVNGTVVSLAEKMVQKVHALKDAQALEELEKLGLKGVDARYAKTVLAYELTLKELSDATLKSKIDHVQAAMKEFAGQKLTTEAYAAKVKAEFNRTFEKVEAKELNALRASKNGNFAQMADEILEKRLTKSYFDQVSTGSAGAAGTSGSVGANSGLNPTPKGNQAINSNIVMTSKIVEMAGDDAEVKKLYTLLEQERQVALAARQKNTAARDAGGEAARQKRLKGETLNSNEQAAYDAYEKANRTADEALGQVNKRRNEINQTVARKLEKKGRSALTADQKAFVDAQKMNDEVTRAIVETYDLMIREVDAKNPGATADELASMRRDIEEMKQLELETNSYIQYTVSPGERGMMRSYDPKCDVLNPTTSKDLVDMHKAFRDEVVERAKLGQKICGDAFGQAFLDRFMRLRREGLPEFMAADYAGECGITPKGSRGFLKNAAQRAIAWTKSFKEFVRPKAVCK